MTPRIILAVSVLTSLTGLSRGDDGPQLDWTFNTQQQWAGWSPTHAIKDVAFKDDGVEFRSTGSDPQINSPSFALATASNSQWVEIELTASGPGSGELFYTNKTTGEFGGLEPSWMVAFDVPDKGRHVVRVWPFWGSLGKIIRLRLDPPSGVLCRLHAIRIVQTATRLTPPAWDFHDASDLWTPMYTATIERKPGSLNAKALRPQGVLITPVEPFNAMERSILRLDASCPGERLLTFYWVSQEQPSIFGQPVELAGGQRSRSEAFDLRQFPEWKGRITHVGIGFGTHGGESLNLRSIAIEKNDPSAPFLRLRHFGFATPINRTGSDARIRMTFEHAGGPPSPAGEVIVKTDAHITCAEPKVAMPALQPGERTTIERQVALKAHGFTAVTLQVGGQSFTPTLRIDQAVPPVHRGDHEVPPPRPVKTRYQIGAYYFPGWAADQLGRWTKQADFPERDSLLGWYEEGNPAVAEWHIKWAVENALSFFIYDWYWQNDHEVLGEALNQGFLNARYGNLMKFAIMWANHRPFSGHTEKQLVEVTDYWIAHYFKRANYLTIDGKPYVSFFTPDELLECLGSAENIAKAFDAMRARARAAGLPGLHIAACAGQDASVLATLGRAGFDSVTAYNYPRAGAPTPQSPHRSYLLGHETIWKNMQAANVLPYVPLLTVNWDSRPWAGPRAEARFDRRTENLAEAFAKLKANLDARGEKLAILEAWNEWGEGSYFEPNAEFGFADLEALRTVFAEAGKWPKNIGPGDVGLEGKYDLRLRTQIAPAGSASTLSLVGVHPAVIDGLELMLEGDAIRIRSGNFRTGQGVLESFGGRFPVPPSESVEIRDLPMKLVAGPVQTWHYGNRLVISPKDPRSLLNGSYVPGSLRLRSSAADAEPIPAKDYSIDDTWGAFTIAEAGGLKPDQQVLATYRLSLRRVDALILAADGSPRLLPGKPSADCPDPPTIPAGAVHLANIYRPFQASTLKPEHIYIVRQSGDPDLSPLESPRLAHVLEKMKTGKAVKVVCWGDSVTSCGESSKPEFCYVNLFESLLRERFANPGIQVVNAGIGGTSTAGRWPGFQKEVLDHHPDVVTLEFINDMGYPIADMQKLYTEILRRTREAGAELVLITPHFSMPSWMNFPAGHSVDPRPGVAFLRRFAAENAVPLADAARRWEQLAALGIPYEILLRNGINHPEDRGHRFFTEELMRLFPR